MKIRKLLNFSLYPIILGFLYFHVFKFSQELTPEILQAIKEKLTWFNGVRIVGLLCAFYFLSIVRWFLMMRTYNKELKFRDAAVTYLISSGANLFFIAFVGDFLRVKQFSKHLKVPSGFTFGVVLLEPIYYGASYCFLGVLFWIYEFIKTMGNVYPKTVMICGLCLIGLLIFLLFMGTMKLIYYIFRNRLSNSSHFFALFLKMFYMAFNLKYVFLILVCGSLQVLILEWGLGLGFSFMREDLCFNYSLNYFKHPLDKYYSDVILIRLAMLVPLSFMLSFKYRKFFGAKEISS